MEEGREETARDGASVVSQSRAQTPGARPSAPRAAGADLVCFLELGEWPLFRQRVDQFLVWLDSDLSAPMMETRRGRGGRVTYISFVTS